MNLDVVLLAHPRTFSSSIDQVSVFPNFFDTSNKKGLFSCGIHAIIPPSTSSKLATILRTVFLAKTSNSIDGYPLASPALLNWLRSSNDPLIDSTSLFKRRFQVASKSSKPKGTK